MKTVLLHKHYAHNVHTVMKTKVHTQLDSLILQNATICDLASCKVCRY